MAETVIDIITRLNYEISEKPLDQAIKKFKEHIQYIDYLNMKIRSLKATLIQEDYLGGAPVRRQIENDIKRLTAALDAENAALSQTVSKSKELKNLVKEENKNKDGGFLKSIFGDISSPAGVRQILNGILTGIGVGGGFGLITTLVSTLIDVFKNFGNELFNTNEKQLKLKESIDAVSSAIEGEISKLEKLNNILSVYDSDNYVGSIQREIEILKAKGIVNGEVYASEKELFDKTQRLRGAELSQLEETKKLYEDIKGTLVQAAQVVDRSSLQKFAPFTASILNKGNSNEQLIEKVFARAPETIPKSTLRDILTDLGGQKLNGEQLYNALLKTIDDFELKRTEIEQKGADKSTEITAAELEFESKLREKAYSLQIQLEREVRQKESEYKKQKLEDETTTSKVIAQRIDIERKQNIALLNDRIIEARKSGILTTENEALFGRIRNQINAAANLEFIQKNREFLIELQKQYRAYMQSVTRATLENEKTELKLLQDAEQDTLGTRQRVIQLETAVAVDATENKYSQLIEQAKKFNLDTTELAEQREKDINLIIENGRREGIAVYEDYFSDLHKNIVDGYNVVITDILNANEDDISALGERFDKGLISYRGYLRRRNKIALEEQLATNKQQQRAVRKDIVNADSIYQSVSDDPTATKKDIEQAGARVKNLQRQLSDLQDKQRAISQDIKNNNLEAIRQWINAYSTLAQAAANAYSSILQSQIQSLDTEIEIRRDRVDQATRIAERGNTEVLRIEEERLREAQKKREVYAQREIAVNAALQLSNSLVAIAEAASESGAGAIVIVPAVIAAIAAGLAAVSALSKSSSSEAQFKKGGYTGDGDPNAPAGTVHKGEYVMPAKQTKQFRPLLEYMHNGIIPPKATNQYASRMELKGVENKLDRLIEVAELGSVNVSQTLDRNGLSQMVEMEGRRLQNRFR